jgi:hypothetical protein
MIGTLCREPLDRVLIVNERHLRQTLDLYLSTISIPRGPTERSRNSHRPKPNPNPPQLTNLADREIHRKPILDRLTSEYQITA